MMPSAVEAKVATTESLTDLLAVARQELEKARVDDRIRPSSKAQCTRALHVMERFCHALGNLDTRVSECHDIIVELDGALIFVGYPLTKESEPVPVLELPAVVAFRKALWGLTARMWYDAHPDRQPEQLSKQTVYIVRVKHKHGDDVWACATDEGARDSVYDYACQWWDDACGLDETLPESPPDDREEAIKAYFAAFENEPYPEDYNIEPCIVQP